MIHASKQLPKNPLFRPTFHSLIRKDAPWLYEVEITIARTLVAHPSEYGHSTVLYMPIYFTVLHNPKIESAARGKVLRHSV